MFPVSATAWKWEARMVSLRDEDLAENNVLLSMFEGVSLDWTGWVPTCAVIIAFRPIKVQKRLAATSDPSTPPRTVRSQPILPEPCAAWTTEFGGCMLVCNNNVVMLHLCLLRINVTDCTY